MSTGHMSGEQQKLCNVSHSNGPPLLLGHSASSSLVVAQNLIKYLGTCSPCGCSTAYATNLESLGLRPYAHFRLAPQLLDPFSMFAPLTREFQPFPTTKETVSEALAHQSKRIGYTTSRPCPRPHRQVHNTCRRIQLWLKSQERVEILAQDYAGTWVI